MPRPRADEFDEGPTQADLERFDSATRACPACGAELYDDADVCWKCGHAGDPPARASRTLLIVVGVTVLVVGLAAVLWR